MGGHRTFADKGAEAKTRDVAEGSEIAIRGEVAGMVDKHVPVENCVLK